MVENFDAELEVTRTMKVSCRNASIALYSETKDGLNQDHLDTSTLNSLNLAIGQYA